MSVPNNMIDPDEPKVFGVDWQEHEIAFGAENVYQDPQVPSRYIQLNFSQLTEVDMYAEQHYEKLGMYKEAMLYRRGKDDIFTAKELLEEIPEDWEEVNTNERF